jgi:hypothetical protein
MTATPMFSQVEILTNQLVSAGVPRDKAIARARAHFQVAAPDPAVDRDASILEKTEQLEIIKRFRVCHFRVYTLSQPRATKQTPGLPDLWCMHEQLPIAFWWESKRQIGGKHSDAQKEFAELAKSSGVRHGSGDRYDAERYLVSLGCAEYFNGVFEPVRA